MFKFDATQYQRQKPVIQLAPLVDIAFWALIFFMVIAIFNKQESEIDINIPKSSTAEAPPQSAGKIVINISRSGAFVVNSKEMDAVSLSDMLAKVSKLFANQQVIIRADAMTYHKFIIQALDACLNAGISEVSFAAIREQEQ